MAAHADDESIGCGGLIGRRSRSGQNVVVCVLTRDDDEADNKRRAQECHSAMTSLSVEHLAWGEFGAHPLQVSAETVTFVADCLKECRPHSVLVPHPAEADEDHVSVYRIARAAFTKSGMWPTLVGYEVWTPIARPTLWQDISAVTEAKQAAIRCYGSQLGDRDYASAALSLNRFRGIMSGRGRYVEAFEILHS